MAVTYEEPLPRIIHLVKPWQSLDDGVFFLHHSRLWRRFFDLGFRRLFPPMNNRSRHIAKPLQSLDYGVSFYIVIRYSLYGAVFFYFGFRFKLYNGVSFLHR